MSMDFETVEAKSLAADYGVGDSKPVRDLEVITQEVLFYKSQAGLSILEIGKRLIEAKEQLSHGEWESWLEEKVDFSARTARRFMQIAENYDKTDTGVLSLGVRKALALLALPDSERDDFVSEKHDVDGVEKTVEEMTSAELERAIRERDEANRRAQEAEQAAEGSALAMAELQEKLDEAAAREKNADYAAEELRKQLAAAEQKAADARRVLDELAQENEQLRGRPADVAIQYQADPAEIEAAARKARDEEQAKYQKKLQLAEKTAKLSREQQEKAEAALKATKAEIEALQERLKKQETMADPAVAAFKALFDQWQKTFHEMDERIMEISRNDAEKGAKLRAAVRAAAEPMRA